MTAGLVRYDIVIPTVARPSLDVLLERLSEQPLPPSTRVVLADDRPRAALRAPLAARVPNALAARTSIVRAGGQGPAAARNLGWGACGAPWVVFLDDDVLPHGGWAAELEEDLDRASAATAAVQGRIVVPQPEHRAANDRERNVGRLATAAWITADLAVRREVLKALDGFDERFPRAYREDTDFQLRAEAAGHGFARGERTTLHPASAAPWWSSVAAQRGNADDALLRALHGPGALDRGRRPRHQLVTFAGAAAVLAAIARRHRPARILGLLWVAGTAEFAVARIRPGPKELREMMTMLATSVAIPPAATYHWWRGRWRWREVARDRRSANARARAPAGPRPSGPGGSSPREGGSAAAWTLTPTSGAGARRISFSASSWRRGSASSSPR